VILDSADAPPLRVLEMVARDKACEHPDKACHGESCPLAQGFYDRLPAARQAASRLNLLNQAALREVARQHTVCPYYLSQEMARWADVVVADYNYYFDFSALLFGLAQPTTGLSRCWWTKRTIWWSAGVRCTAPASINRAQRRTKNRARSAEKALQRVNREWNALHSLQQAPYQAYDKPPEKLLQALSSCSAASVITSMITRRAGQCVAKFLFRDAAVLPGGRAVRRAFLFDISKRDLDRKRPLSQLCLRNVVPAVSSARA
jgi:hypothetical protein